MKKMFVNSIMDLISKNTINDEVTIKKISYGIETLYLTITKTITFILISIVFNYEKELLLLILFYTFLRLTGFGLHAKKSLNCWILSSLTFIALPLICKYLTFSSLFKSVILLVSIIILIKYAPADTEKRPLINKKKRNVFKLLTILLIVVYLSLVIFLDNIVLTNIIIISIVLEGIMVHPFFYKVMGLTFDNYKTYQKSK